MIKRSSRLPLRQVPCDAPGRFGPDIAVWVMGARCMMAPPRFRLSAVSRLRHQVADSCRAARGSPDRGLSRPPWHTVCCCDLADRQHVLWAVLLLGACLVFYYCSADRTRVRALGARYMGERLYRVECPMVASSSEAFCSTSQKSWAFCIRIHKSGRYDELTDAQRHFRVMHGFRSGCDATVSRYPNVAGEFTHTDAHGGEYSSGVVRQGEPRALERGSARYSRSCGILR